MIERVRGRRPKVAKRGIPLHRAAERLQRYLWRRAPWLVDWRTDLHAARADVTTRYYLRCLNHNRAGGSSPADECLSVEQFDRLVRQSLSLRGSRRALKTGRLSRVALRLAARAGFLVEKADLGPRAVGGGA